MHQMKCQSHNIGKNKNKTIPVLPSKPLDIYSLEWKGGGWRQCWCSSLQSSLGKECKGSCWGMPRMTSDGKSLLAADSYHSQSERTMLKVLNVSSRINSLTWNARELSPRYLPFPQPTSKITAPGSWDSTKFFTFGHGLCLVSLKWLAISSYTFKHKTVFLGTVRDSLTIH